MPYNKGDFTQQGVAGDVSALVRLNEKRVMKVVLSSDDESDNCDISGKVYDLLNGTSYDIGSGGGGGDSIPKCTVTVINNTANNIYLSYLLGDYKCIGNNYFLANVPPAPANDSANYTLMYVIDEDFYYIAYNSENMTLTNMVNCEVIVEGDWTGYISPIDETLDSSFTLTIDPVPPLG